ncbi:H-NS family nucleoid-associated regulatory protein [Roseateles sp. MS654]|uniref:H-NS histone family protein n=1 Tax=Roseateles sp. MS654 TaxID=3412685 RepID=UPI003C2B970E
MEEGLTPPWALVKWRPRRQERRHNPESHAEVPATCSEPDPQAAEGSGLASGQRGVRSRRSHEAIAHYNLTPEQLFGGAGREAKGFATSSSTAAKRGRGAPKYQSDDGRTWSGVGKRPAWFVEALANGRSAEELLVAKSGPQTASTSRKPGKRAKTARSAGVAKYASADDGHGRVWASVRSGSMKR